MEPDQSNAEKDAKMLADFRNMIEEKYTLEKIREIEEYLKKYHTFDFPCFPSGLYSAALIKNHNEYTGYQSVWVRDNMHITNARYTDGYKQEAVKAVSALLEYFKEHNKQRFDNIISGKADSNNPMERPHIRFNGETLDELNEKWAHAQNDALGYFLWQISAMVCEGDLVLDNEDLKMVARFPLYFQKIAYWQDPDSGHWEEKRKIEASSIGPVISGLKSLRQYLELNDIKIIETEVGAVDVDLIDHLINKSMEALDAILPWESKDTNSERRYDAALLFLIYPLGLIKGEMANKIISDVQANLQGELGIRRYQGDSFWCADYKEKLDESVRTADFSDDMSSRDSYLKPGEEAQWCIFDPIISIIYGNKYLETKDDQFYSKQITYFNRSLKHITLSNDLPARL